jgi:hypothetical protein
MLNAGLSWRLFFYIQLAFALALLIVSFFVVEETTYHRTPPQSTDVSAVHSHSEEEKGAVSAQERPETPPVIPNRKTFAQTLKFWGVWEKDSEFFRMMARSFTYFLVPQVFWVITSFGAFSVFVTLSSLAFAL